MIIPTRRRRSSGSREVGIGRGSQQTVYVLGADGQPKPIQVRVGDSNGSQTEVSGKDLKPGMKLITGQLANKAGGPMAGEPIIYMRGVTMTFGTAPAALSALTGVARDGETGDVHSIMGQ